MRHVSRNLQSAIRKGEKRDMPPMFRRFAALMLVALLAAFLPLARPAYAATIHVTNTNDSGAGSLRLAMTNAVAGDSIVFDNAGALWTIQPLTPLPTLDNGSLPTPGGTGQKIVLAGSLIQSEPQYGSISSHGIKITSSNNTVKGLVIVKFPL